jgi:hypothetical protein
LLVFRDRILEKRICGSWLGLEGEIGSVIVVLLVNQQRIKSRILERHTKMMHGRTRRGYLRQVKSTIQPPMRVGVKSEWKLSVSIRV